MLNPSNVKILSVSREKPGLTLPESTCPDIQPFLTSRQIAWPCVACTDAVRVPAKVFIE